MKDKAEPEKSREQKDVDFIERLENFIEKKKNESSALEKILNSLNSINQNNEEITKDSAEDLKNKNSKNKKNKKTK